MALAGESLKEFIDALTEGVDLGAGLVDRLIEMGDDVSSWMSDFMYSSWEGMSSLYGLDITVV